MCFYEPPLFLGMPDLSAAIFCALPLAASATRPTELVASFMGLAAGFLAAHIFIVALHYDDPPSAFYRVNEQAPVAGVSFGAIGFVLLVLYAISQFVRSLWQREYWRAARHILLALVVLAAAAGAIGYLVLDARAFESTITTFLASNTDGPIITNCVLPPFGDGVVGYTMLAALVVFEILVAIGVADLFNRNVAPKLTRAS